MTDKPSPFEIVFDKLCSQLSSDNKISLISKEFTRQSNDFLRIKFLLKIESVQVIVQLPADLLSEKQIAKSAHLSKEKREAGNGAFQSKKYNDALNLYTESLAYAPVNVLFAKSDKSDETVLRKLHLDAENDGNLSAALAYANRSAVLFHMHQYAYCLEDICKACDLGYPVDLRYKLEDRRGRSLLVLNRSAEAVQSFNAALEFSTCAQMTDQKRKQLVTDLQNNILSCQKASKSDSSAKSGKKVLTNNENSDDVSLKVVNNLSSDSSLPVISKERNDKFPSLSSSVQVVYSAEEGRHIVAEKCIGPGEVILVEDPYAAVLLPDQLNDHCSHCFKYTLAPHPCQFCHSALYCSEECRTASATDHRSQCCGLLEILRCSGVDKFAFLAICAVTKMSLEQVGDYRQRVDAGKYCCEEKLYEGCTMNGMYESQEYNAICCLVTNDDKRTAHDLFRRGIIAVYLLRVLQHIGYFQSSKISVEDKLDLDAYIGSLLLSHLQSFPCNAHEISEFDLDLESGIAASEPHELGAGIYATLSLFNHSCDPAVTRSFYGRTCVVRTIRALRPGEEVSDNYGAVHAMQTREQRRKKLSAQYFFECACIACINSWPLYADMMSAAPQFKCDCGKSENISCTCDQNSRAEKLDKLTKSYKRYKVAFDLLLAGKVRESLPELLKHLSVLDELCDRPWSEYSSCQEAVKQCYSIMSNCRIITRKK